MWGGVIETSVASFCYEHYFPVENKLLLGLEKLTNRVLEVVMKIKTAVNTRKKLKSYNYIYLCWWVVLNFIGKIDIELRG